MSLELQFQEFEDLTNPVILIISQLSNYVPTTYQLPNHNGAITATSCKCIKSLISLHNPIRKPYAYLCYVYA